MKQNNREISGIEETLATLNGIPHGLALLDRDRLVLGMNHFLEALTGYTSRQVFGLESDFVIRSSITSRHAVFREALENQRSAAAEGDMIICSRKKIPVRLTVTPCTWPSAELKGFVVCIEDLSLFRALEKKKKGTANYKGLIGHSPQIQELLDFLPVMGQTDATILITGETGTGKDLLAESIHNSSKRAPYPFIKVNCGALPESLLESELFGHVRGAFTGAHADKPGMFRLAQGGTIFLTEIGDLPLPLQVKLLTVLDDRAFFPVGGSKQVQVDVRIIAATHRSLKKLVEEGRFRQDLYFRLCVLNVSVPPLRDRDGDIKLLAEHFTRHFTELLHKNINGFSKEAEDLLTGYNYPGNVRELRNIIEYAVSVCKSSRVEIEHLPDSVIRGDTTDPLPSTSDQGAPLLQSATPSGRQARNVPIFANEKNWPDAERKMIMEALLEAKGNRGEAAKRLGWGRSTLWRKMQKYKISDQ